MFAVVDCNNFFVSCERVFRPDLEGKPVMVLSNNDGCIVSRSQEVKALGIPMGAPAFKYKEVIKQHNIVVFSANFALYGDMSVRVMRTLAQFSDQMEVYSIDEAFLSFPRVSLSFPRRRESMAGGPLKSEVNLRAVEISTMDPRDSTELTAEVLRGDDMTEFGFKMRDTVKQWTGIPVSVGFGPTKTLAKAANELAKQWEFFGGVSRSSAQP